MTYQDAISKIKNPYELNRFDEAIEGYDQAEPGDNTKGYRIYALDEKGYRYSPGRLMSAPVNAIERNVYYWHNKDIASAYMAYLAEARPQYTYGLFPVEAVKGRHEDVEGIYDEHTAHFGQVAQELHVVQDSPIRVFTPDMYEQAQKDPTRELFTD